MKMRKYHGLGNDYLVLAPQETTAPLCEDDIRLICSQHYGAGSDGILTGPHLPGSADFMDIAARAGIPDDKASKALCALRILNPDGSEAEKSGNGLRIFSRFLYDTGMVNLNSPFMLLTLGGCVTATVLNEEGDIRVDMGTVHFSSPDFPGKSDADGTRRITVGDKVLRYCPASVGNPHCVVLDTNADKDTAIKYGPLLEVAPEFPNRINVQFLKVINRHSIFIEIWERGAAYTLASGSSASACAAVAVKLGYCDSPVDVHMPGGILKLEVLENGTLVQTGPTELVYEMKWLAPLKTDNK